MEHGSFTHRVANQTPPLPDLNLFSQDLALKQAAARAGLAGELATLMEAGALLGQASLREQAALANRHTPVLSTFNASGERIDRVEFHPAWHALMQGIAERGYHSGPWAGSMSHAARAAGYFMQAQIECGTLCPTTMTYGAIAAMRRDADLAAHWVPKLLLRAYDPADRPIGEKRGGLVGMGMTEKQGGSDVRANATRATRDADGSYSITGHKWFFSAPQCDAHLVLAQSEGGLSCFFMPRRLADGSLNGIYLQRLKDKLGNRSNASSEVEFVEARAQLLGEEGRGIPTILEMGTYTRLDCVTGSAGMMRQALTLILHHAAHRRAFGALLIEQPLMQNVLADLAVESEAATALCLRLARAFDSEAPAEVALRRVLTSAAKFWICKRGIEFAGESMEVLGGNGYTEELPLARILREMPVNSIWEGSGNIMCLDVLRAFAQSSVVEAVLQELSLSRGLDAHFDAAFESFAATLQGARQESDGRGVAQHLVTLMQGALLLQAMPGNGAAAVAEAFCATRLNRQAHWGAVFGTSRFAQGKSILARAALHF